MLNPDLNSAPDNTNTIHILGICGTGMAALAAMLQHSGYTVTGSDSHVYPPMSNYLQDIGITPFDGYRKENMDHNPDLVIVGNVITSQNPEAIALGQKKTPYLSFPQALATFYIAAKHSIVVTGTHGKTTTCSLLASSLFHAGLDPSFMIGGIVSEFKSNNRIGQGKYFVVEGDEYDTAFFDKESKFLHYLPKIAVITSLEFDHADIFTDLSQIKNSFRKFVTCLPPDGLIIANLDDANVTEIVSKAPCQVEGYGFSRQNHWRIEKITPLSSSTSFSYSHAGNNQTITIPLSGKHNCLNSLAVAAVLHHTGLSLTEAQDSIEKFQGVKRRQEVRGKICGVTVMDDFAHHPTAVKETLAGLKNAFPENRLVAVFEPRTNSSRRSIFQKHYAKAFKDADLTIVREPLPLAGFTKEEHFSAVRLAADLTASGKQAWAFATTDEILNHIVPLLLPGDLVIILSNGGFDNIHERLLLLLEQKFEGTIL